MLAKLITCVVIVSHFTLQYVSTATVICYYQSWRADSFPPSDIDCNTCNIINYSFLGVNGDGSLRLDGSDSTINKLKDVKKKCPKVKLVFSVGGWNEGSKAFSQVAADSKARDKLAASVVQFCQKYNFDGIDIDWEYPGQREGSKPADKGNYVELLKTLRSKLKSNGKNYLVTIAVQAYPEDVSYDVPRIVPQVDFINVMTYDFTSDGKTSFNSPLYGGESCDSAIKRWKSKGAPSGKLVLGLAFYGRTYMLQNANNHGVGAPATLSVALPYSDVCQRKNGWHNVWDDSAKVPYKYKDTTWITYDDTRAIAAKVQYAKKQKLGGVMMWAVDQDDNKGSCGSKFPLLNEIKKNL